MPAGWQHVRYLAAVATLCPSVAVLGAKRPQDRGWQFIVASLWLVAALPSLQQWFARPNAALDLHVAWRWFLLILIAIGLFNILPTRYWPTSLLTAAGQACLLTRHLPLADSWSIANHQYLWPLGAVLWCVAVALWGFDLPRRRRRSPTVGSAVARLPRSGRRPLGLARGRAHQRGLRPMRLERPPGMARLDHRRRAAPCTRAQPADAAAPLRLSPMDRRAAAPQCGVRSAECGVTALAHLPVAAGRRCGRPSKEIRPLLLRQRRCIPKPRVSEAPPWVSRSRECPPTLKGLDKTLSHPFRVQAAYVRQHRVAARFARDPYRCSYSHGNLSDGCAAYSTERSGRRSVANRVPWGFLIWVCRDPSSY